jgi:integrase/recombinase XerD
MHANGFLLLKKASISFWSIDRRLPYVLTQAEVEAIIAQADTRTPQGLRDRAMMEVLYSTAMRRTELSQLLTSSLDFERGTVFIRKGKFQKDRLVPIGERALAWVEKYLQDARQQMVVEPDEGLLFISSETGMGVPAESLSNIVRRYIEAAGVQKPGSCHLFRHTAATLMLENGADIRFIQELLGHAELQATKLYTHVSIRKLKEVHEATHPGAKLQRKKRGTAVGAAPGGDAHMDAAGDAHEEEAAELLAALEDETDADDELPPPAGDRGTDGGP